MPRYFFHTRIGQELIRDPVGEELHNADRAFEVAREMIREILESEEASAVLLSALIVVTDDEGEIVFEFPFSEAVVNWRDERATRH